MRSFATRWSERIPYISFDHMIIPVNLSPKQVRRLRSLGRVPHRDYYVEEVEFDSSPSIIYVSPKSISRKRNKSPKLSVMRMEQFIVTHKRKEVVSWFDSAPSIEVKHLLEAALNEGDCRLMLELGIRALQSSDKSLHRQGMHLAKVAYPTCNQQEQKRLRTAIERWLQTCGYLPLPILLELVSQLLSLEMNDEEWRFVENIIAFCIFVKSPDVTKSLTLILTRIRRQRNIVLYISNSIDAHFTDYLRPMERRFFFVQVDPRICLYISPQGYPMPVENLVILFNLARFIWWRKPDILPQSETSLEKFTKQEIREFVEQLRIRYSKKIFPQFSINDRKFVYFPVLERQLEVVKVCKSSFENSSYLWSIGDFIKPLSTQVVYSSNAEIEQSFSPFIYTGDGSEMSAIMPPVIRQDNIHKEYEIRGTFFIDDVSCARIDTAKLTGYKAGVDWRYSEGTLENMYPYQLPGRVVADLLRCFKKMAIRFCTFDLVFDGKDYYLLDVNHNGQWIFSDEICDLKITRKMVAYLGERS